MFIYGQAVLSWLANNILSALFCFVLICFEGFSHRRAKNAANIRGGKYK